MAFFERMRGYFREPCTKCLCSMESHTIYETLEENNPLPWKHTKELLKKWNRGRKTPLYSRMGIYKDR